MTTVVNFVCDRLPDPDGCRFIELENDRGESVGDDVGVWRHRDDGLVELRVELSQQPTIATLEATIAEQAKMIEHLRGGPTPLYTAVDMANAARDERNGIADSLIERLATEFTDSETMMTVECFADWLSKEMKS